MQSAKLFNNSYSYSMSWSDELKSILFEQNLFYKSWYIVKISVDVILCPLVLISRIELQNNYNIVFEIFSHHYHFHHHFHHHYCWLLMNYLNQWLVCSWSLAWLNLKKSWVRQSFLGNRQVFFPQISCGPYIFVHWLLWAGVAPTVLRVAIGFTVGTVGGLWP
jgi:hypothetical protein